MEAGQVAAKEIRLAKGVEIGEVRCISGVSETKRRENVFSAFARKLPRVSDNIGIVKDGRPCAIVGGGPSLRERLDEVRNFPGDVIVCGTAHAYLMREKVPFQYCVNLDASGIMQKFLDPSSETATYLIATTCHPATFDVLKDRKVWTWNAAGEATQEDFKGELAFAGGSTAALRAWPIAHNLGYPEIHFYGVDSSFADIEDHHADPGYWPAVRDSFKVKITGDPLEKEFWTNQQYAAQAYQFATMLKSFRMFSKVIVHGDTLTAAYARIMMQPSA